MQWYLVPWKKFANFSGRAHRTEYWTFTLVNSLVLFTLYVLGGGLKTAGDPDAEPELNAFIVLYLLFALAILIPSLAVGARRLHDTSKTGWLQLLNFVPCVGGLILFVFFLLDSHPANQYGPNPKDPSQTDVFD